MAKARERRSYPLTAGATTGAIEICITYPLEFLKAPSALRTRC